MADEHAKSLDIKSGASAPDETSRPLIVGHKAMLGSDPMMKPATDMAPATAPKLSKDSLKGKTLLPGTGINNADESGVVPHERLAGTGKTIVPTQPIIDVAKSDTTAKDKNTKVDDEKVNSTSLKTNELGVPAEGDLQSTGDDAYNKLLSSKKYFIQIKNNNKSGRIGLILGIASCAAIFVIVIGALAIDAGFIKSSIKLPFDLIKEPKSELSGATVLAPKPTTPTPSSTAAKPSTTPTPTVAPVVTSSDTVNYDSKEIKLKFDYPKTWTLSTAIAGEVDLYSPAAKINPAESTSKTQYLTLRMVLYPGDGNDTTISSVKNCTDITLSSTALKALRLSSYFAPVGTITSPTSSSDITAVQVTAGCPTSGTDLKPIVLVGSGHYYITANYKDGSPTAPGAAKVFSREAFAKTEDYVKLLAVLNSVQYSTQTN